MDGHSGIENRKVNENNKPHFKLILAFLKSASGNADFVIHVTSNIVYGPTPHPFKFLEHIGFERFEGECPFFHTNCFWRHFAKFEEYAPGIENTTAVQNVHNAFNAFVNRIEELYDIYKRQGEILRLLGESCPSIDIFASKPPIIKIQPTEIPHWIEPIKFSRLIALEKQRTEIEQEIKDLQEYLPLVFGDGDILVSAVLKSLRKFGLSADSAVKGYTVDILAETQDGSKKFGIEVTGCTEGIKKDSKKLTQVLEFEMKKEHDEKTILIANTYKNMPIEERASREHFTQNVVDFLSRHPILLMTGYDMYRMVSDVMENRRTPDEIIKILFNSVGVLKYL
ncbi:MAG: hypothetical protein ABIL46_06355 [candidate division WOR-3 bacterium]